MGSESEPAKLLLPFLQRADELQKHEPLVAYYCRLYAMEKGLKIPQKERTKTTNSILISLMNQLEKDKKSLKLGPDDYLYVEGFASNVFAKADKQDMAGRADLNTAKTFYAASIFFEILSQFGELQPDIVQKLKYAVWKAADIRKALKDGRRPEPGPPGGNKDLAVPSSSPSSTYDLGPSESFSDSQPAAGMPTRAAETDLGRGESFPNSYPGADLSSPPPDRVSSYGGASQPPASSSSYPGSDYPPGDYQQPLPSRSPDISPYPQHRHSQSYTNDQQSMPQNYQPENPMPQNYHPESPMPQNYHPENPSSPFSYPNFQSYPSLHEASFPAAPTHQPSYYHGADASYSHQSSFPSVQPSGPSISNYTSPTAKHDSGSANSHVATPASSAAAASFTYDSNYQPPAEKIAEAHKAARFAVGALAFDDVPVAVEFLRKSLELLTNPSAQNH